MRKFWMMALSSVFLVGFWGADLWAAPHCKCGKRPNGTCRPCPSGGSHGGPGHGPGWHPIPPSHPLPIYTPGKCYRWRYGTCVERYRTPPAYRPRDCAVWNGARWLLRPYECGIRFLPFQAPLYYGANPYPALRNLVFLEIESLGEEDLPNTSEIRVEYLAPYGLYGIKIRIGGAPVWIESVVVMYDDGTVNRISNWFEEGAYATGQELNLFFPIESSGYARVRRIRITSYGTYGDADLTVYGYFRYPYKYWP